MARHHYVPQSVLREFVSANAWTLLRGKVQETTLHRIRDSDARAVSNPNAKHRPLCVLRKEPAGNRLTRGTVRETCSTKGFYGLVQYEDPVLRGVLRNAIDGVAAGSIPPLDISGLRRLGVRAVDADEIERRFIGRLDGPFANVAAKARRQESLSSGELDDLRRSLMFARHRTPAWRRIQHSEIEASHKEASARRLAGYTTVDEDALRAEGYDLPTLLGVADDNMYLLLAVLAATGKADFFKKHDIRVSFLHAIGELRFVTCDNPMRPYIIDALREITTGGDPTFGHPAAMATYPLSPTCCAFLSGHRLMPHGQHGPVEDDFVRKINTALLLMAHEEVVLPRPDVRGLFEPWADVRSVAAPRRP